MLFRSVAFSYLAAQVVTALVTGADDPVLALPILGHRSRRWEPEPFRWIGINTGLLATRIADRLEARSGRRSRVLTAFMRLF